MNIDADGEFRSALLLLEKECNTMHSCRPPGGTAGVSRQEIEEALQRLDAGEYGVCSHCLLVIPRGQLLSRPWERLCDKCRERANSTITGRVPARRNMRRNHTGRKPEEP